MNAHRASRSVLHAADLSLLERTYLGVLDLGMVTARVSGDPSLRLDRVTAVCMALRQGHDAATLLDGDHVQEQFTGELIAAIFTLDDTGAISTGPPPPDSVISPEDLQTRPVRPATIDFDHHPRILDRYLAHECMEELFRDARVYPFLMGKYQDSGEVWARLYKERPERFL